MKNIQIAPDNPGCKFTCFTGQASIPERFFTLISWTNCVFLLLALSQGVMLANAKDVASPPVATNHEVNVAAPANSNQANLIQAGPLTLEVIPQYMPIAKGTTTLNVMLRLKAAATNEVVQRPPLDLAVVLDRSGSMAGDKLRNAKQAALDLIKLLTDQDFITLIAYDDKINVYTQHLAANAEGKNKLRRVVLNLTDGGSTALGPALIKALGIIGDSAHTTNRLQHIMLLSDGLANVGETSSDVLGKRAKNGFNRGISISTLGLGTDYNEDLMTHIADQGGGRYHFIADTAAISGVLQTELAGLNATVVKGLSLKISLRGGINITKVFGYPIESKNDDSKITVGWMHAGQTREILIRLTLPATLDGKIEIGQVSIQALDTQHSDANISGKTSINVEFSTDTPKVAAGERTEVTVRVAELEAAEKMEDAAKAVEAGNFDQARKTLQTSLSQTRIQAVQNKSDKLQQQVRELEQSLNDIDAAQHSYKSRKMYIKGNKNMNYYRLKK
ncbi:hypothetical protein TI04_01725 [Achromatium sp. WMS2]|nr:hypothetical protein TI04_01725 [Achromatium sp. WMS2]